MQMRTRGTKKEYVHEEREVMLDKCAKNSTNNNNNNKGKDQQGNEHQAGEGMHWVCVVCTCYVIREQAKWNNNNNNTALGSLAPIARNIWAQRWADVPARQCCHSRVHSSGRQCWWWDCLCLRVRPHSPSRANDGVHRSCRSLSPFVSSMRYCLFVCVCVCLMIMCLCMCVSVRTGDRGGEG